MDCVSICQGALWKWEDNLGSRVPVLMSTYLLLIDTHTNIWNKSKINIGFKDIIGMALKAFIKCKLNCDKSELIFFTQ